MSARSVQIVFSCHQLYRKYPKLILSWQNHRLIFVYNNVSQLEKVNTKEDAIWFAYPE